jgi:Flp pilus assembly protein TadG
MIDESNPFYAARKAQQAAAAGGTAATAGPSKASYKDSSDAANDILRKMLERRRASR